MKTKSLLFLTVFLLSAFLYAAPQGDGIVLDGTGGLTVKDFKLTGNTFTVSVWVKVKNTDASQIFVSLGAPAASGGIGSSYDFVLAPNPQPGEGTRNDKYLLKFITLLLNY